MNRLKDATSPYLLQHADNPVDWFDVGRGGVRRGAAARRAAADQRRLLGVPLVPRDGPRVLRGRRHGRAMNEHFVNVKVDREERPDVDAVYMAATQAMTGQGGWPMTVFATPEGHPFYAGTYFPRQQFQRLPVRQVLERLDRRRGSAVLEQGSKIVEALNERSRAAVRAAARRRTRSTRARARPGRRRSTRSAAASAGRPSSRRRWCWSSCCGTTAAHRDDADALRRMAERDAGGHGPRRHLRPARRRLRPLQRGRRLGRAALREDALRQRPAPAGLRALVARDRLRAGRGGSRWRRPTGCCASCAPPRAASPRPWTPTARARRAVLRLDPASSSRRARRRRRRLGGRAVR